MSKVDVYCDESGNSGDNYVDVNQPFFVLGAWAMPCERLAEISTSIETCRTKYAPQSAELKSRSMLRTPRNRHALVDLFLELGTFGSVPLFLISEKRFFIAAKIVDTFADPATNPLLNNSFTGDSTSKVEIANSLYGLSSEILNRFAKIYRRPTREGFETCLNEITAEAVSTINKEIATLLNGCRGQLDEIAELEANDELLGTARATLNLPAFVSMLMMIEQVAREGIINPRCLIHDEQSAYGPVFEKIHSLHLNAKEGQFIYPNGAEVFFPIKNVATFAMESSKSSPYLQAADLLAGVVAYISKKVLLNEKCDASDLRLAEITIPLLWSREAPRVAWSVASNRWMRDAIRTCLHQDTKVPETQVAASSPSSVNAAPLPLLPTPGKGIDDADPMFRFPSRPVGLVRTKDGQLMLLKNLSRQESPEPTAVLLFSSEEAAQRVFNWFDGQGEMPEPYDLVEFDGPGFLRLGELLLSAMEFTEILIIDYMSDRQAAFNLESAAIGYNRVVERVSRAAMSGPLNVIFETHDHNGHAINTILSGDGSYTAVIVDMDRFFKGVSRESALAAAKAFLER